MQVVTRELTALYRFGVARISDRRIQSSVISILENDAPWTFFLLPASLTGRRHPSWQGRAGGILRNTVECCVAVDRQLRVHREFTDARDCVRDLDRDVVLSATILSDIFKYGMPPPETPLRGIAFQPAHGKIAAELWKRTARRFHVGRSSIEKVYQAIYWHLGRWTPGWRRGTKLSLHAKVTHRIDMFFSDKNLELLYHAKHQVE